MSNEDWRHLTFEAFTDNNYETILDQTQQIDMIVTANERNRKPKVVSEIISL